MEVRKAQVARNLSDEQTMQLFQQNFEHSLDQVHLRQRRHHLLAPQP